MDGKSGEKMEEEISKFTMGFAYKPKEGRMKSCTKTKAIICDIDGTLANIEHRRHFVDPSLAFDKGLAKYEVDANFNRIDLNLDGSRWKPDWKSFNESMIWDTPNEWCANLIRNMIQGCDCERKYFPIFVTGREECWESVTENQIYAWVNPRRSPCFALHMRPRKDYRPDVEIKREIYEKYIKDKYDVLFCIDDRDCVVKLWRSLGLVCLQCSEGNF